VGQISSGNAKSLHRLEACATRVFLYIFRLLSMGTYAVNPKIKAKMQRVPQIKPLPLVV
jgi:hypothetical protein